MKQAEHIKLTKEVLLATFDYCDKNSIKFWVEESNDTFKFKIGEESDYFESLDKKGSNPYIYSNISEVNQSMIYHTDFNLFRTSLTINSMIQATTNFAQKTPEKYNKFYIDFFWQHGKDLTKILQESYLNKNFDLNYIFDYKTEQYPNGFSDNKVIPYTLGLNWRHFLDTIPNNKLVKFWENQKRFEIFYKKLKELKKTDITKIHPILNTLTERLVDYGLSEDALFKTSYMLMDVLPAELHKGYASKFPLMNSLINKLHKDSLFPETEKEIIERVIFPKFHLYDYFNNDILTPSQYSELAEETLLTIKNNYKLEEKGLISADITGRDDVIFYMVLKENSSINKAAIKFLCINIMESFMNHNEMMIEPKASLLRDKCNFDVLQKISDTEINHWILDKELAINNENVTKTKLKKV